LAHTLGQFDPGHSQLDVKSKIAAGAPHALL